MLIMLIMLARDPANFLAFPNVTREQEVYALQGEEKPPLSHLQSRWLPRSKNRNFSIKIFAKSLLMQSNLWERRIKLSSIKNWYPNVILLALEYVFCHANNQIFTAITSAVNPLTITIISPLSNWISPKRLGCFRPTHPQSNLSPTHCPSSTMYPCKRMIIF